MQQYVCVGWTGSGSVSNSGTGTNTGPIVMSRDSNLAWHWKTNMWLDTEVDGYGAVNMPDGWYGTTAEVTVVATPGEYTVFDSWRGDTNGSTIVSNQITVTMSTPRELVAHFDELVTSHGTPWWWLASYQLTNSGFEVQAGADPDGDRLLTWEEWIAGTIPTNELSVLRVAGFPPESAPRRPFTFLTVPGRSYRVISCGDLIVGNWLPEPVARGAMAVLSAAPLQATGDSMTVYIAAQEGAYYYRIIVDNE